MTLPSYEEIMLPVLKLGAKGVIAASSAVDLLAEEFSLTEEERTRLMPSGRGNQTLFNNRVHWAITYLAHAGLLVRPRRAHFETTARGREVLSRNLSHIDNDVLAEFDEFRSWLTRSKKSEEQSGRPSLSSTSSIPSAGLEASVTPLERIEADHEEITSALKDDGEELASLMVRHNVGVRVEAVYEIKRIDEDMFEQ